MIEDGLLMLGVVLGIAMVLIILERTTGWKVFRFVPGMVMMYLLMATRTRSGCSERRKRPTTPSPP